MQDIKIERNAVNIEALDAELRTALGSATSGISTGPYGVVLHLADAATPQQINQARQIVQNHDPSALTAEQQAEIDRQQKLAQARSDNAVELDVAAYDGQDALIRQLAQKTAWLEQEALNLRGLA